MLWIDLELFLQSIVSQRRIHNLGLKLRISKRVGGFAVNMTPRWWNPEGFTGFLWVPMGPADFPMFRAPRSMSMACMAKLSLWRLRARAKCGLAWLGCSEGRGMPISTGMRHEMIWVWVICDSYEAYMSVSAYRYVFMQTACIHDDSKTWLPPQSTAAHTVGSILGFP